LIPSRLIQNTLSRNRYFRRITKIGYYGLNKIDFRVEPYINKRNGYFIELGANDGIKQSNTLFCEKYLGFTGLLIEPHPGNFASCIQNRSKRNTFVNAACVGFEYESETIEMVFADLMTTPLEGRSELADPMKHALNGIQYMTKPENSIFLAKARTLNSILQEVNAPCKIDFLSLDVEGAELEVLLGIDYENYTFGIICIESRNIDLIANFLSKRGYKLTEKISHHDYIFQFDSPKGTH
jgi:FkbM family methyltransferase